MKMKVHCKHYFQMFILEPNTRAHARNASGGGKTSLMDTKLVSE